MHLPFYEGLCTRTQSADRNRPSLSNLQLPVVLTLTCDTLACLHYQCRGLSKRALNLTDHVMVGAGKLVSGSCKSDDFVLV